LIRLNIWLQIFIYSFIFMNTLIAQKVEITSEEMHAENIKKKVHFIGNVNIKQNESWIHADKVIVYFNEHNETRKYNATGNVTFEFKELKHFYKGSANKVTYLPLKSQYILKEKAIIEDIVNKRHVHGDKIVLDMLTGNAKVQGTKKKPVKFIFDLEKAK